MKVKVDGKELTIKDGAKVKDLGLPETVFVVRKNVVLLPEDLLHEGDELITQKILSGG